jgi:hypothetical protein
LSLKKFISRVTEQARAKVNLEKLGLNSVQSTMVLPGSTGGIFDGKLRPLPTKPNLYKDEKNNKDKITLKPNSVQTYLYFFVQYQNSYMGTGEEVLYSFSCVRMLSETSLNDFSVQLGVKIENSKGLSQSEYESGIFYHPTSINDDKTPLAIRYAEVPLLVQKTPGRLDNVALGAPNFNANPSPIITQKGMLPQPPYPDFSTDDGSTGATAVGIGATVGFLDKSLKTPFQVRPSDWNWSFGDGVTPTGSTAQNPVATFASGGTYTITLVAINANGSGTITKAGYVTVS